MGVRGLFAFIKREKIRGGIRSYSIECLTQEIAKYQSEHKKKPKILINLRAFNHYYEQNVKDAVFGGRLNKVKKDFENFLATLKNAGAELIFVVKSPENLEVSESNEDYRTGMVYVTKIRQVKSAEKLVRDHQYARYYPWNNMTIKVMAQSAMKFGTFHENECSLRNNSAGQAETASNEDVFGLIGLNTSYLFYEGDWRFFYPMAEPTHSGRVAMNFKEYDKRRIMAQFNFNMDQMRLFAVLGGKFASSEENERVLANYFSIMIRDKDYRDFHKIISFIHQYAPRDAFPLNDEKIKSILREIFGFVDDDLMRDLKDSLQFEPVYVEKNAALEEVNELMRNNPYSYLAQKILNNYSFEVLCSMLDVTATDMKSLKDLTLPWLRRTCGVLFKNDDESPVRMVSYRADAENWESIEIFPKYPDFDVPPLMQLLAGEMSNEDKFKMLAFLINDLIDESALKEIPRDFIMHKIIVKHLVENNSMTRAEERAMTKTVKDGSAGFVVYPQTVNVRLFRISALYSKMFEVLTELLYACGLEDFIADFALDSVLFQQNYCE